MGGIRHESGKVPCSRGMGLPTARPEHGGLVGGQGSGSKEVRCRSSTLGWDTGQGHCGGLETRQGTCAEARG